MSSFHPHLQALPPAQRSLWPNLRVVQSFGFVLYGGTALALRYAHRISEDFDFFSNAKLERTGLYVKMPFLSGGTIIQDDPRALSIVVRSAGDKVKLSFFGELKMGRIAEPQCTDDRVCEVASELDLFATKLGALSQRIEPKDYLDVVALLRAGVSLEAGLGAAAALYGNEFSPRAMLKTLTYFEPAELAPLPPEAREYLIERVANVKEITPLRVAAPTLSLEACRQRGMHLGM